jgi:penicillin-binding protein 2
MIEKYLRQKITRTDLEIRILKTSLQGRYAKLGGLSDAVKLQLRIQDSILKSKIKIPKIKIDSTKQQH